MMSKLKSAPLMNCNMGNGVVVPQNLVELHRCVDFLQASDASVPSLGPRLTYVEAAALNVTTPTVVAGDLADHFREHLHSG